MLRRRNKTPRWTLLCPVPQPLEERLLRNGVDALEADRNRCLDCGRTPLIGEHVHLYDAATERDRLRAVPDAPARAARRKRDRPALRARPRRADHRPRRLTQPAPGGHFARAVFRLAVPVDPVSVSIVVSAPREQVFDYLQDIANHSEFTDHYLVDWHLTRIDSVGRGPARASGSRRAATASAGPMSRSPRSSARTGSSRSGAPARTTASARSGCMTSHPPAAGRRACASRCRRLRRRSRTACSRRSGRAASPGARARGRCAGSVRSSSRGRGAGGGSPLPADRYGPR